jgi:hypothetical protein
LLHFLTIIGVDTTDDSNARRLLTFNSGNASARTTEGQHGLWLHDCRLGTGLVGRVKPWIGSPNFVTEVCVDTKKHRSVKNLLSSIAHELGHAVNLTHPGVHLGPACEKIAHWDPYPQGGVSSGDVNNIMRYSSGLAYIGRGGRCYDYLEYDTEGVTFVNSLAGTGINGGQERRDAAGRLLPMSGDATWADTRVNALDLTSTEPNLTGGFSRDDIKDR